jgi:hypothetical protein
MAGQMHSNLVEEQTKNYIIKRESHNRNERCTSSRPVVGWLGLKMSSQGHSLSSQAKP